MTNADIGRIINSNEVQSVLKAKLQPKLAVRQRKNPLKNASVLGRMCPWAATQKKINRLAHVKGSKVAVSIAKKKAVVIKAKKAYKKNSKQFFAELLAAHKVVAPVEEEAASEE